MNQFYIFPIKPEEINMNEPLNKYFDSAKKLKKMEPVVSMNDIQEVISVTPVHIPPANISPIIKGGLSFGKIVLIGSITTSILLFVFTQKFIFKNDGANKSTINSNQKQVLLAQNNNKPDKNEINNKNSIKTINDTINTNTSYNRTKTINDTTNTNTPYISKNYNKDKDSHYLLTKDGSYKLDAPMDMNNINSVKTWAMQKISFIDGINSNDISGIKMIELTPAELEKLNIQYTDDDITFFTERVLYDYNSGTEEKLKENGYDISNGNSPVLVTEMNDIINDRYQSTTISPVLVEKKKIIDKPDEEQYNQMSFNVFNMGAATTTQTPNTKPQTRDLKNYNRIMPVIWGTNEHFLNYIASPIMRDADSLLNAFYENLISINRTYYNIQKEKSTDERKLLSGLLNEYHNNISMMTQKIITSKLIPVKINLNKSKYRNENLNKLKYSSDVLTLWYYPTQEFLDALPAQYSSQIKTELGMIDNVKNGVVTIDQACGKLYNEASFFDFCRVSSGAVTNVKASPNPATDNTNLSYDLKVDCKISISLHDLNGKHIKTFLNYDYQPAGQQNINIPLSDIEKGFYLLAITTEKGEQVIQRLIIQ